MTSSKQKPKEAGVGKSAEEGSGESPGRGALVRSVVRNAAKIAEAIQPAVNNLATQYPKLKPLKVAVDAIQAGTTEAEKQLEDEG
jgi:hypothetical protein